MKVWDDFSSTSDPFLMLKKRGVTVLSDKMFLKIEEAIEKIRDEDIKEFGLSDSYKDLLRERRKKALLQIESTIAILSGDKNKHNQKEMLIKIQDAKLDELSSIDPMPISKQQAMMSKWVGSKASATEYTIYDFKSLRRAMQDG